jgi:hypothetical protein
MSISSELIQLAASLWSHTIGLGFDFIFCIWQLFNYAEMLNETNIVDGEVDDTVLTNRNENE